MNQAEAAHSLLLELKRLRSEGTRDVYVEEDSLSLLEGVLSERFPQPSVGAEKADRSPPSPAPRSSEDEKPDKVGAQKSEPKAIRAFAEDSSSTLPAPPVFELPEGSKEERWAWLRDKVLQCPT